MGVVAPGEEEEELVKCYIWSITMYGAENWVLRNVDQKYL